MGGPPNVDVSSYRCANPRKASHRLVNVEVHEALLRPELRIVPSVKYLAYRHEASGFVDWYTEVRTGVLSTENAASTYDFHSTDASWSAVCVVEYPEPDPTRYDLPPPAPEHHHPNTLDVTRIGTRLHR